MSTRKYDITSLQMIRSEWTNIPLEMLPASKRQTFSNRKMAIDMYIDGFKMLEIEQRTGLKYTGILRLLNRCMSLDKDNIPYGYMGLIPGKRVVNDTSGKVSEHNRFYVLLTRYPELQAFILGNYFGIAPYTAERVMNTRTLHEKFIKKCYELEISNEEYPFNIDSLGYYSLYRFIKQADKNNIELAANRLSKDASQKLRSTGKGKRYSYNAVAPFNAVQVDGHIIDIIYTTQVRLDDGTIQDMTAHRCWLFTVIDIATRCIIGYSTSQEMNYNQYDVLRAFQNAILPHKKMEFNVPGYEYPNNGGFPSLALPETEYALFDLIMLDNAKSHLAKNVREKTISVLNCTLNYGSVATPETRGIVERFFGTLETKGFHRLPMTTDSSITGLKRRNPEYKAVKYTVTYDDILEILEQLIIQYNNSPHEALYNNTPLQEMERKIRDYGMMPSIATQMKREEIQKLLYYKETRKVSGNIHNGQRPYITYLGAKYRNNTLSTNNTFIGKVISLLINPDDVSTVEAYLADGTYLGILRAVGEKGLKSHSLKSRKAINEYSRKNNIENTSFSTPITAYEQELEHRAQHSKRDRTKADILRREEGKQTYKEQASEKQKHSTPIVSKDNIESKNSKMLSAEKVKSMTSEDMWNYIRGV